MAKASTRSPSRKFLSGTDFRTWRVSRGLTLAEVADWLGLTIPAIAAYEKRGATKAVALALAAVDRGLQPYKPSEFDQEAAKKDVSTKSKVKAGNERTTKRSASRT